MPSSTRQGVPQPLERTQGVGLAAASIEGDHQLPPCRLVEWVSSDRGFHVTDDRPMVPQRQLGLDEHKRCPAPEIVQTHPLAEADLLVREVGERLAAPERQCLSST